MPKSASILAHKASYLNGNGFIARGIFYFAVWMAFGRTQS